MNARLALPVLLLLAACGGDAAKSALNTPTIDTLPGGIIRVTNTGPSAWADTNGWKLVLEHTVTATEGSPGQLNNPAGIVADSKGGIYILDQKPATIKAYAPDGAFLRAVGREGSGPGSAWDVFTPDGRLLGRVPAPFADPYRTFWTRDRVYSIEEADATGALSIKVYRIDKTKGS